MTVDVSGAWRERHERHVETVPAPHGPRSLVGAHRIEDYPDGRLPAIPGQWTVDGGGNREGGEEGSGGGSGEGGGDGGGGGVVPAVGPGGGLTLGGEPFAGEVRSAADQGSVAAARAGPGERRLVVPVREGSRGACDLDPAARIRTVFKGVEVTPYDPRRSVPGRFAPYGGPRAVCVVGADGRERGLGLGGEPVFPLGGEARTPRVAVGEGGGPWTVLADSTSGDGGYRSRFPRPAAPAVEGRTTVDFGRAVLPACPFVDRFACPFPLPGNTLVVAISAGERDLRQNFARTT
ncbi:DUF1684 domain-containing protein [Streptomyces geranii]|uniref:DUF1684 domain-containing protein n=1 Tax=Streptomyces geranii TaxID=2058923 RepID=UPI000D031375|nr:DUF1684 domain-containing protein [Streptomyces geranii]